MSDVTIQPISRPFTASITPPGSKSLTNRALVLAALSENICDLSNVLFADDTHVMLESLMRLGFWMQIDHDAHTVRMHGRGGHIDKDHAELFCGNSGTTIRFLTALTSLGTGAYTLDGIPRMRQRPIGQLVELLHNLGVRIEYLMDAGFPPVKVDAHGLPGGIVRYPAAHSSQFLSALLMVTPYARNEVRIDLEPNQPSWPYAAMTMQLMDRFGITPELIRDPKTHQPTQIIVPRGVYKPTNYAVEPDASNATYFLAAAAIQPGAKVTIEGLGKSSLQGDIGFADVLHRMGADLVFGKDFITLEGPPLLEAIDVDMLSMPDPAMTLAVVCAFADGPSTIHGLHTLRVKETDRIAALSRELAKLGASVHLEGDSMRINPPADGVIRPASIDTYDDHRMAMAFAVAGTRADGVTIRDSGCVSKTYPGFFDDLNRLTSGAT
jgi:3-phosphoshikimate 1-carboxyvinyltransferase